MGVLTERVARAPCRRRLCVHDGRVGAARPCRPMASMTSNATKRRFIFAVYPLQAQTGVHQVSVAYRRRSEASDAFLSFAERDDRRRYT